MREQLREFGKFRIAGAERRRALAVKSGEPVEHVHGIVGAALFAVVDDVDAAFDLLLHHMRDRLADRGVELGLARAAILLFGEQELDHLGGARQAAGMRRENPVGTAFHATSISTSRVRFGPVLVPDWRSTAHNRRPSDSLQLPALGGRKVPMRRRTLKRGISPSVAWAWTPTGGSWQSTSDGVSSSSYSAAEAKRAHEMLESGAVLGKLLLRP